MKAGIRDAETENVLAEYRNKISELREQNKQLKQRLILSQQQIQAAQQMKKSNTMYETVSSRIDTVSKLPKEMLLMVIHSSSGSTQTNAIAFTSQHSCHRSSRLHQVLHEDFLKDSIRTYLDRLQ